ncbi:MAG TPA: hypothetical protein PKZ22_00105 [Accumulibacter sp.]|jgi:hypothetical protein|nr:hypothetical protein [Accumulibacter sp.]
MTGQPAAGRGDDLLDSVNYPISVMFPIAGGAGFVIAVAPDVIRSCNGNGVNNPAPELLRGNQDQP